MAVQAGGGAAGVGAGSRCRCSGFRSGGCRCGSGLLGRLFLVIRGKPRLRRIDVLRRHHREVIDEALTVVFRELIHIRHLDAFRRTRGHAQAAIAALRDVDVEPRHIQPLLRPHRGESEVHVGRRLDRLDRDAVHRTGHRALIAPDAVVHVHIQTVACPFRKLHLHGRILDRDGPREQVGPRDLHADQDGEHAVPDIAEIPAHYFRSIRCTCQVPPRSRRRPLTFSVRPRAPRHQCPG